MQNYISYYLDKVLTAYRLGPISILRVLVYKILVRYRLHKVVRIKVDVAASDETTGVFIPQGYSFKHFRFFDRAGIYLFQVAHERLSETLFLTNWFNGYVHSNEKSWFEIPDFDSNAGDIKGVWELSRWYWAIEIATDMTLPLQKRRDLITRFSELWVHQNPYLQGPNWKCGQEVALRLTHFLVAMRLLGYAPKDLSYLQNQFVENHLRRIQPTLSYAKGQKNNHWISEAVGLIIGGLWLGEVRSSDRYYRHGIAELREAVDALFNNDGTFAQSSFNYLRHALTLLSIAKLELSLHGFDCSVFESIKLRNALHFFDQFCDSSTAITHNWGANDGSNPLAISQQEFLDPSAHKSLYDFCFREIIADTDNNVVACLVNAYSDHAGSPKKAALFESYPIEDSNQRHGFAEFPEGGLIFYRNKNYRALVRLPGFKFKPSQDDVGHIDVIHNGRGALIDAGTFSYFVDDSIFNYFQGVQSHNTLYRASEKYSMRKLSRFVFGSWTKGSWRIVGEETLIVNYTNVFYDQFERIFEFKNDRITVSDKVIESKSDDFVSGLTLNFDELNISNEVLNEGITIECKSQTENIFSIQSNCTPSIIDVPVSFCYGEKFSRKRVVFPVKNREVKFEICF